MSATEFNVSGATILRSPATIRGSAFRRKSWKFHFVSLWTLLSARGRSGWELGKGPKATAAGDCAARVRSERAPER